MCGVSVARNSWEEVGIWKGKKCVLARKWRDGKDKLEKFKGKWREFREMSVCV